MSIRPFYHTFAKSQDKTPEAGAFLTSSLESLNLTSLTHDSSQDLPSRQDPSAPSAQPALLAESAFFHNNDSVLAPT